MMSHSKIWSNGLLFEKTALITGASQGIGAATARLFAQHGANLLLLSRSENKLTKLQQELSLYPVKVKIFVVDLTDIAETNKVMQQILSVDTIDVLVNNAGVMKPKPFAFIKNEDILSHFEVNTFSIIRLTQLVTRSMIRQGSGSIINIASMLGEYGQKGQSVYAASKSSISGLTLSLAQELATYNIRVNALAPGIIATELINLLDEKEKNKIIQQIALKRLGEADEVAKSCLFLASELSSYVTGQIIGIDGGVHF